MDSALRLTQVVSSQLFNNMSDEMVAKSLLHRHILQLSHQDIVKILAPVKARLLTDETELHVNTLNFSVDHVVSPITVREVLDVLGPSWQRWIHNAPSHKHPGTSDFDASEHIRTGIFDSIDVPQTDFVKEFIESLTKKQKFAVLSLTRDGLLTDESFLNVSTYTGPDRVQVSMRKVVDVLAEQERRLANEDNARNIFIRLFFLSHYSSANFELMKKTDLDVSFLTSGRQKMSVWYTIAFALMTFGTVFSHVWSNATNYNNMQSQLSVTIGILVIASLAIGALMYLVTYMIAFLFCCENSLSPTGLKRYHPGEEETTVTKYFSTIHQYEYRIWATKALQFFLLWYTMLLAVYAHEKELNIYPALTCVLTNGFGLLLFARISHFFHYCRVTKGHVLHAQ